MAETAELVLTVKDELTAPAEKADSALQGLSKTSEQLIQELAKATAAMEQMGHQAAQLNKQLGGLQGQTDKAKKSGSSLSGMMKSAFPEVAIAVAGVTAEFEFLKGGVEAVIGVAGDLYDRFKELRSEEKVFQLKEGEEGIKRVERLRSLANETGFLFQDMAKLGTRLEEAFRPEDVEELSKVVADIASRTADPVAAMDKLGTVIGKVGDEAVISERDMKMFEKATQHNVDLHDALNKSLAQQLHVSEAAIPSLIKHGQVTGAQFLIAVRAAEETVAGTKKAGDAARDFAKTDLPSQLNRLKNGWSELGDTLAKDVFGDPAIAAGVKELADKLLEFAKDPEIKKFFKELAKSIVELALRAVPLLKSAFDAAIDGFKWINAHHEELKTALTGLAVVFGILGATTLIAMLPLIIFIGILGAIVYGIGLAATAIIDDWDKIKKTFGDAYDAIVNPIKKALVFLSGTPEMMAAHGRDMVTGLIDGIASQARKLASTVKSVAKIVPGVVGSILQIASPSKVMVEMGKNVSQGFALGIDNGSTSVADNVATLASAPTQHVDAAQGGGRAGPVIHIGNVVAEVHVAQTNATASDVADYVSAAQKRVIIDTITQIFSAAQVQA